MWYGFCMKTVILTDSKYRSAISAARMFGRAGYHVVAVQTREDAPVKPPAFASRYVAEARGICGTARDAEYPERLLSLAREYDRPVIFPVGVATLDVLSRNRETFEQCADFLVSPPDVLAALNDKEEVHRRAARLGLNVPKEYDGEQPDEFPVILKPHCGEKLGLKAADRYTIARDRSEYDRALKAMRQYDPSPVVQQVVTGDGGGVCLLMDKNSRLLDAFCHRRLREYPISGGPSTCCESVYDPQKINEAFRLLRAFRFVGLAMVEYKGDHILEVNPRVWGSFPLTALAHSSIAVRYAEAASGREVSYSPRCDYDVGVRMRFQINDTLAALSLYRHGQRDAARAALYDRFLIPDAFEDPDDPRPARAYLRSTLTRL